MTSLLTWLADVLLGPACPGCNWRARGPRSLATHLDRHPTHHPKENSSGA